MEIKGKFNTAKCYAKVIEKEAIDQIQRMCDYEFSEHSKIRIMPDVHAGAGCTIGTTMTIQDKVVPNIVGVDIGCGMYVVNLGKEPIDLEKLDNACHYIPSGTKVWDRTREVFDMTELRCYEFLKNKMRLERSLGTLGGGNHFIEVDISSDGTQYLVIHSGSRNLGKQVAEIYQRYAVSLNKKKDYYFTQRNEIIEKYKTEGRESEIEEALNSIVWINKQVDIPPDLCFLYGEALEDYLHDIEICQQFAKRNREKIAEIILKLIKVKVPKGFHTIHNYIDVNEMILRKGAIAAHKGEIVLIPINMRDGSILAVGKGNEEWNYSAPHGAGRLMSRKQAKEMLTLSDFQETMAGIYTTSVNKNTIDESPMAYKSLDDIIDVVQDTVDIIEILKPIYNFKAPE